jgi:hypothetical protein
MRLIDVFEKIFRNGNFGSLKFSDATKGDPSVYFAFLLKINAEFSKSKIQHELIRPIYPNSH